ncbi:dienelactone hydrolase family protein [Agromyces bauzanensis]
MSPAGDGIRELEVRIPGRGVEFAATMAVPAEPTGFVVFAHGSGSSRHSPRNRFVAETLQYAGLGTLLVDLLALQEEADRANVFDIELLAERLVGAVEWLDSRPEAAGRPVGFFGASTGAGAALWAAADPSAEVAAVVSRGGRPDLAGRRLADVRAPTLLIVGGDDTRVIELNRLALAQLTCPAELRIVPGATHLFEEPGTLEQVADLARGWFLRYLGPQA